MDIAEVKYTHRRGFVVEALVEQEGALASIRTVCNATQILVIARMWATMIAR